MSKFVVSESTICSVFESDLKSLIDCIHRLLFSDVSMSIVTSMHFLDPRYDRLISLRDHLYTKLLAYRNALWIFYDACALDDCCHVTV